MSKRNILIGVGLAGMIFVILFNQVYVFARPIYMSISLSENVAPPKAPTVLGKVKVQLEASGCKLQEGNIRLRFDYFLDPSALGYSIHHVYVIDEASPVWLAGYKGTVSPDGTPVNQADYDTWVSSLPHIWRDNPFVCVFVYIDPTMTDLQIATKAVNILNEAYQYWGIKHDMRGFRTSESAKSNKTLTPEQITLYQSKLTDILNRKAVFTLAP
jgi:hypothetical protein